MSALAASTRVLFVDDEPAMCRAFERSMRPYGWEITTVDGGPEALALGDSQRFDVVVTDLRMPGIDGLTLTTRLHQRWPDTVFVLVTGVSKLELDPNSPIDTAIASVVTKPWEPKAMSSLLWRAAELGRTRASLPPGAQRSVEHILVVEDNVADAAIVKRYLRENAVTKRYVDVVKRLDQAMVRLQARAYDVAIVDLSLPDARGLDSVAHLHRAAPDTAIIVNSGHEDETVALQALQLGAQDVLAKSQVTAPLLNRTIRFAVERKRTQQRLAHLAHFDQLTGLANRSTLHDRLEHALDMGRRRTHEVALVYVDLDGFKEVNDTHGHSTGDKLLQQVARRLQNAVRACDTVARLGGDEFAILLEDTNEQPSVPAQRIVDTLSRPFDIDGRGVSVTGSVGVAVYPQAGRTAEELVRSADVAMYEAKAAGKSRVTFA